MLRRVLRHPFTCLVLTLVLFALLDAALELLVVWTAGPQLGGLTLLERDLAVGSPLRALAATLALVAVGRGLEGRPPAEVGLRRQGMGRELVQGGLLGAALMGTVVGVLALAGWYRLVEGPPETPRQEALTALGLAGGFLFAGYFEEVVFRGILFRLLEEWLGSAAALLLSSALFGLVHRANPDATWFSTLAIALEAGLLLGGAFMLTRSLWLATGIHWAWNWVQGPLLGVDVSGVAVDGVLESRLAGPVLWTGGAFGAEAGGVALLLGTAVGVALVLRAARAGEWRPFLAWRRQRRALASPPAA